MRKPVILLLACLLGGATASASENRTTWNGIVIDAFGGGPILAETGIVTLALPERAEDAALVPMTVGLALPPGDIRAVRKVTLVIDENPAPIAAVFEFASGRVFDRIEGRYRVDGYTHVHAVAELDDGSRHMAEAFIKASGGCSAPATRDLEASARELGRILVRRFDASAEASGPVEAQVGVRHPNWSGLQIDHDTRGYLPARFVHTIGIAEGGKPLVTITTGISVGEDPTFRMTWRGGGAGPLAVRAEDTDGAVFERTVPFEPVGVR